MKCRLCGEPMPAGEEMFKYHGFSGPCPKPPLTRAAAAPAPEGLDERISPGQQHEAHRIASIYGVWEREKNELHILRALRARPALSDIARRIREAQNQQTLLDIADELEAGRPALSDEALREMADEWAGTWDSTVKDVMLNFARAVVARQFDCAVHAIAAITGPDPKLLTIAGLVNTYHNDSSTLSAAETLRAIADVLGDPFALVRQQEGS